MIFTQTYIQMMKESPIQKEWLPRFGHHTQFGIVRAIHLNGEIDIVTPGGYGTYSKDLLIWLLTSDDWVDLFVESEVEMFKRLEKTTHLIWRLRNWTLMEESHCKTLPELLSHFWHYEKGLIWNGTNWEERKVCISIS